MRHALHPRPEYRGGFTRHKLATALILPLCLAAGSVLAQRSTTDAANKMDRLIVYGKDFAFGVREPEGWQGDTGEVATKYQVNIVFIPTAKESRANNVTIRVRVNGKVDENTVEDLNYDMEQYKREYPRAQFSDFDAQHPQYKTFAKLVYVPNEFYEYVAYANPGPKSKNVFSAAMSKRSAPATADELKAFKAVLQSIVWLPTAAPRNK